MNSLTMIERHIDPFPAFREMRNTNPVFFDQEGMSWHVFCYGDVQRVLSDYQNFSSEFSGGRRENNNQMFAASMIATDPPRHRQLRSLVTQAFTPKAVDALAPRIIKIVQQHLDAVESTGQMDVIRDLAIPLPVTVIAEMLGIPAVDQPRFKEWSDYIVQAVEFKGEFDPEMFSSSAIMEMATYFFAMLEQRRQEPGDDLISGLFAAKVDGESLSLAELLGFCALLVVAGNETTTNLIGNAILTFAEHPEDWQRLRAERDLLPLAIDEVLRYRSPVQSMFRLTKQHVKLSGQNVPPGALVVAWIGSANHDEDVFPDAERFLIDRSPNRHLAFGNGIHYCLGAPLARLEAKIALGAMLDRFETFRLAPDTSLERLPSALMYGVRSLPISLSREGEIPLASGR